MRRIYRIVVMGLAALLLMSCVEKEVRYASVPLAKSVEIGSDKAFVLSPDVKVIFPQEAAEFIPAAKLSLEKMEEYLGYPLENTGEKGNRIIFSINRDLPAEGFHIEVTSDQIRIEAGDYAGTFYAYQWLYQTLLLQKEGRTQIPALNISDYPSTSYRGAMLDVSRHFFSAAEVREFIDLLALHRLNHFHWHLSDDQGWRMEVRAYPRLTEVGAWQKTPDGGRRGGFYTQEEIRDIVRYAAERAITIIPEIDLPGHSSAVLASYPELGCTGGPYHVADEVGGVHKDVLCLGKEKAWKFAREVLAEVAELFPASYIHIGGDEVPRDRWKACPKCQRILRKFGLKDTENFCAEDLLQGKFNEQMSLYLKSIGKQMIGWDEVLTENIDPETVIMSWRGLRRGTKALKMGHPAIFSSNGNFYFNNYQTADYEHEPESSGGFLPMSRVFEAQWDTEDLSAEERERILGVEACLWTSYVRDMQKVQYDLLPRLAAFSEVAWGNETRDYGEFLNRLPDMLSIYEKTGRGYAPHFFDIKVEYASDTLEKNLQVRLHTIENAEIYYTLDGSQPDKSSRKYTSPIRISDSRVLKALAYTPSGLVSDLFEKEVQVNKATFCSVRLLTAPAGQYPGDGGRVLVDGVRSPAFHTTGMWVGYISRPMVAVIDLGKMQTISQVAVSSFTDMPAHIMGIRHLKIEVSEDGEQYRQVAQENYSEPAENFMDKLMARLVLDFEKTEARYVKLSATGFGKLPYWHPGAGTSPCIFVDEIEIN